MEGIKFTDRELYRLCLAMESYLNNRETYLSSKGARETNRVLKKLRIDGMKRKDPKAVIQHTN